MKNKIKNTKSFIIVYCHWAMDNITFEEEIYEAENSEMADQYAAAKAFRRQKDFWYSGYYLVKATKQITVEPKPRKLTWLERLKGRVDN